MVHLEFQNSRYPSPSYLIDQKGRGPPALFGACHIPAWQLHSPGGRRLAWAASVLVTLRSGLSTVLSLGFLFPSGMESRFSQQSADVMTTTTNKRQALQLGIKWFTNKKKKGARLSCKAESPQDLSYLLHFDWHSPVRQIGIGSIRVLHNLNTIIIFKELLQQCVTSFKLGGKDCMLYVKLIKCPFNFLI